MNLLHSPINPSYLAYTYLYTTADELAHIPENMAPTPASQI